MMPGPVLLDEARSSSLSFFRTGMLAETSLQTNDGTALEAVWLVDRVVSACASFSFRFLLTESCVDCVAV